MPIPTLPSTIKPFAGAAEEIKLVPIETLPLTESLLKGLFVPMPIFFAKAWIERRIRVRIMLPLLLIGYEIYSWYGF